MPHNTKYSNHTDFLSCCYRNLLVGSVSTNDYEVVPFPGLQELFSVESPSQEVRNEINKHIGDIMTSMVDAMDYSKRAIMDSSTFPTTQK